MQLIELVGKLVFGVLARGLRWCSRRKSFGSNKYKGLKKKAVLKRVAAGAWPLAL